MPLRPPSARLGPRPLPLHLGTALMTWASSESAWKLWKPGSPNSNQSATPESIAALLPEIAALEAKAGPGGFERALHREIGRRMARLADGVLAYRNHPVHRTLDDPPAVWSEGNTRLLDYGATDRLARARGARAVLVVPSLINRWEVLDLTMEKSLLRAMAAQGLRPYLVDWGTPNAEERRFDTTAYVARLERALAFVTRRARKAPAVMGYCMGGTLTVALAARQPRRVAGLALLAAPWDFHADTTGHAFLLSAGPLLARVADQVGELPVDILQTLFWSLDPWLAVKKFGRFLGMDQQGSSAHEFVLLEDWLNEGAPLAGPTARECLIDWYGDNLPGTGKWMVGGKPVVPSKVNVPSLVMIPSGDRIVPPLSAAALAEPGRGLKRATRLDLPLGHIGMVVSGRAREVCWTPLIDWLKRLPTGGNRTRFPPVGNASTEAPRSEGTSRPADSSRTGSASGNIPSKRS
jgi:polyhydroxyalkanoate synthase subunit PhaC